MLPNKCYLKDIKEWEEKHQINVLSLFEVNTLENLMLILSIFYKDMPEDDLYQMIDSLFNSGYGILDLYIELRNVLLGYTVNKCDNDEEEKEDNTGTFEDVRQYRFLSDFYMHLCMQLMSLGMSYSEFWSLTTCDMYKAFDAIQQKMVYDYNRQMQGYHMLAGLIGGGVWGKLPKEAPQINMEDLHDPDEEIDTPLGRMTREDYKNAVALQKVFATNDAKYSNGGLNNG